MSKQYTTLTRKVTARPRSPRLRQLGVGAVVSSSSTAQSANASTIASGESHTHSNLDVLETLSTQEGYLLVSDTDDVTGESVADKVKAGYADAAATADEAAEAHHATTADEATKAHHAVTADAATEAHHAVTADAATEAHHAVTADAATEAEHASTADNADKWDNEHLEDWLDQPVRRADRPRFAAITTDYLTVLRRATFTEVEIQQVTHAGGQILLTAAYATISHILAIESGWRCFYPRRDEGKTIEMLWEVGDQAYANTFNLTDGTTGAAANHFLWRRVIATSVSAPLTAETITLEDGESLSTADYHYIDLSESDAAVGSDAPQAGDCLVLLGSQASDAAITGRQTAILIAAAGEAAPAIMEYAGIEDYSLPEPETRLQPGANRLTGQVKLQPGSSGFENLGAEIGGDNLLRNSGFTGDYLSERLADDVVLDAATEMWGNTLVHWETDGEVSVQDSTAAASGKECVIPDGGYICQTLTSTPVADAEYILSALVKGDGTATLTVDWPVRTEEPITPDQSYRRFTWRGTAVAGRGADVMLVAEQGEITLCDLQVRRGNVPTAWRPSALDNTSDRAYYQALRYLADALGGNTEISGGLILSSLIQLGKWAEGKMASVKAGVNGVHTSDDSPAFWAGGTLEQAIATIKRLSALPTAEFDAEQMAPFAVTHGGDVYAAKGHFRGHVAITGTSTGWENFSGLKNTLAEQAEATAHAQKTADSAGTAASGAQETADAAADTAQSATSVAEAAEAAAAEAKAQAQAMEYLRRTITDGATAIAGGLILANILGVGGEGVTTDLSAITAYLSGRQDDHAFLAAHDRDAYAVAEAFLSGTSSTRPRLAVAKDGKLYASGADIEGNVHITGNLMVDNATRITMPGNYIIKKAGSYIFGNDDSAIDGKYNVKIDVAALPAGAVVTLISHHQTYTPSDHRPTMPVTSAFYGRDGRGLPIYVEATASDDTPGVTFPTLYLDDESADGIMPAAGLVCICHTEIEGINAGYDLVGAGHNASPEDGIIYHDPVNFLSFIGGYVSLTKIVTGAASDGILFLTALSANSHLISADLPPCSYDNAFGRYITAVRLDLTAPAGASWDGAAPILSSGTHRPTSACAAAVYHSSERIGSVLYSLASQIPSDFSSWI